MVEILRNKNAATAFQVLVEVATKQPNVQQRDIAGTLGITPQAVSDYVKQLLKDGRLISGGRSRYRISTRGVDWILKQLKELQTYAKSVEKTVSNIKVSAAVANSNLFRGQTVGLIMKEGVLMAISDPTVGATGVATTDAVPGDDIGVTDIQGIIHLEAGDVAVLVVPSMQRGGSKNADLDRLRNEIQSKKPIAATGVEALTALRRIGIQPDYVYGFKEAIIGAASSGLSPAIVCTDEDTPALIRSLGEVGIRYLLTDLRTG
jgi:putative transcriptional regulator